MEVTYMYIKFCAERHKSRAAMAPVVRRKMIDLRALGRFANRLPVKRGLGA